jgi:MscS family membrane protein
MDEWGFLDNCRYLIHDRDTKYCQSFRDIIESGDVKTLPLPARSPNLNAFAERWVRFAGFGDFSLNVEIRVDIDTSDRNEFRAIREDIYLRVMKIVKDAGTGFAFPSRTVYQARDDGLNAERQQASEAQVRAWCSAQELPFPTFTAEYRKKTRNTLDYPPDGSPQSSE